MKFVAAATLTILATYALGGSESSDPRTPWGTPDFTGTYDTATLTPLERPRYYGTNLYVTKEQAEKAARDWEAGVAQNSAKKDPNREAPPEGGDGSRGPSGNVGGYNAFWIDQGDSMNLVDGKYRRSILTYPENGRIPAVTATGRDRFREIAKSWGGQNTGTATWLSRGDGSGPYDNPERLTLADRCLQGFSSTGGPPMMPALYNNHKRIVQGPNTIVILVEMVHDARVIRLNSEHPPEDVELWMGDSIGWWEDDTLLIETTNFNDTPAQMPGSRNMKVTEKFKRNDERSLLYSFTVEDPTVWKDKWSGEYTWPESDENLYEYACHEGNYAMGNILRGARRLEREALAAQN